MGIDQACRREDERKDRGKEAQPHGVWMMEG